MQLEHMECSAFTLRGESPFWAAGGVTDKTTRLSAALRDF